MRNSSPSETASPQISLLYRAVIYAKDGSRKLVDGRWNLSQSESKLGIKLSAEATQQLMACTGQIVCATPDIRTVSIATGPNLGSTHRPVIARLRLP